MARYLYSIRARTALFVALIGLTAMVTSYSICAQTQTDPWVFASSPDWFNMDVADLSGSTPDVPQAPGWPLGASDGLNGVSPEMLQVYNQIAAEMSSRGADSLASAGDLINGYWFGDPALDMFDPGTRDRRTAIDTAADIYYPWLRQLFASHGITTLIGALGDHEIGDNPWPPGSEKSLHVQNMKEAFGRNMVAPLGLPERINGARTRPIGTAFENSSFAFQLRNVLFVSVDAFHQADPAANSNALEGSVTFEVTGQHLQWLSDILTAADADATIDHVIVQGHVPVLDPVRIQLSSGLMMIDREDSAFWQVLRDHDHSNGGKVRMYFAGEVHVPTVVVDPGGDIVQLVHGNPPTGFSAPGYAPGSNYVLFTVHPQRIEAELRRFELTADGTSQFWQAGTFGYDNGPASVGPNATVGSTGEGTLVIDSGKTDTLIQGTGWLEPVPASGLAVQFQFDARTQRGNYSNTGSFGDLYYEGFERGYIKEVDGKFGEAIDLDGASGYVESGRGSISGGETRTIGAWVKLTAASIRTIVSYGTRSGDVNSRFNFRIRAGKPQLEIGTKINCNAGNSPIVNDGTWHHVAVALAGKHVNRCEDVRFFVDGAGYPSSSVSDVINTTPWNQLRIGVNFKANAQYFKGSLDDVAVWHAALTDGKIKALVNAANETTLRYDARDMDQLFRLYDRRTGSVVIDSYEWRYATGLPGEAGEIGPYAQGYYIQIDQAGTGVATESGTPPPSHYGLLCSSDSVVDGNDPTCDGGTFDDRLWVYLWPETDVGIVDFYLDGQLNNRENYAPWELDGGQSTLLSDGTHDIRALISLQNGDTEEATATIEIGSGTPPPPEGDHTLLCSADSIVDGNDAACNGGMFDDRLWIYLWPESDVARVDFYLDGQLNNSENYAPWELGGGQSTQLTEGIHEIRALITLQSGDTEEASAALEISSGAPPPPPAEYTLLCSTDAKVDGNDAACDGGEFGDRLWIYLWPSSGLTRVRFLLDGVVTNIENYAPWELHGGDPTLLAIGSHTVQARATTDEGAKLRFSAQFVVN